MGGAAFVQQNVNFADAAFPGLQIKDQLVLVDGNLASVRYFFQATANGHFAGLPPTGNKIEVTGGETFLYDENALLYRLITVEPLDKIILEVEGVTKINAFQDITTLENPQMPFSYRKKIKNIASTLDKNFNLRQTALNTAFVSPNIIADADGTISHGTQALLDHFENLLSSFPDLLAHDEYILSDGHYASTEIIWQGTRNGTFTATNGTVVPPNGKMYRVRGMRWVEFNDEGLMTKFMESHNNDDFLTQAVS